VQHHDAVKTEMPADATQRKAGRKKRSGAPGASIRRTTATRGGLGGGADAAGAWGGWAGSGNGSGRVAVVFDVRYTRPRSSTRRLLRPALIDRPLLVAIAASRPLASRSSPRLLLLRSRFSRVHARMDVDDVLNAPPATDNRYRPATGSAVRVNAGVARANGAAARAAPEAAEQAPDDPMDVDVDAAAGVRTTPMAEQAADDAMDVDGDGGVQTETPRGLPREPDPAPWHLVGRARRPSRRLDDAAPTVESPF